MKKNKTKKIIMKIILVVSLITTFFATMIIPSFAYQTTTVHNDYYNYQGLNSYAVLPFTQMNYMYYSSSNGKVTQYSYPTQNIITFASKSNWNQIGYPLTTNHSERVNESASLIWGDWESALGSVLTREQYAENYGTLYPESEPNFMYLVDDFAYERKGTNLDCLVYVERLPYQNTSALDVTYNISNVSIPVGLAHRCSSFEFKTRFGREILFEVDYDIDYYSTTDGTFRKATGTMQSTNFSNRESSSFTYGDKSATINCYIESKNIISETLVAIANSNKEFPKSDTSDTIYINDITINVADGDLLNAQLYMLYLRPYNEEKALQWTLYANGRYRNIYTDVNENFIKRYNPHVDVENLDLTPLGSALGGAVNGVLNVTIFPGVPLWTFLAIPFSLGVLFVILRYFAGG